MGGKKGICPGCGKWYLECYDGFLCKKCLTKVILAEREVAKNKRKNRNIDPCFINDTTEFDMFASDEDREFYDLMMGESKPLVCQACGNDDMYPDCCSFCTIIDE